jgi:FixJ family two-component response regulator
MVMTAHEGESFEESAMNAGAKEFLRKPFEISELLMKFHRMLHVQRKPEAQQNREQGE